MEDLLTVNVYLSTVSIFGNIESQQRFCFLLQIIIYLHFRSWQRINTTSSCLNKCSSKLSSLEIFPTKVLIMKTFLIPERFMLTGSTWLLEYSMINIYQENMLKNQEKLAYRHIVICPKTWKISTQISPGQKNGKLFSPLKIVLKSFKNDF